MHLVPSSPLLVSPFLLSHPPYCLRRKAQVLLHRLISLPLTKSKEAVCFGKQEKGMFKAGLEEVERPSCLKSPSCHTQSGKVFYSKEQSGGEQTEGIQISNEGTCPLIPTVLSSPVSCGHLQVSASARSITSGLRRGGVLCVQLETVWRSCFSLKEKNLSFKV